MSMKVTSSKFLKSAVRPDGYPDLELPEIAFVGRSNVGKSSLINRLLNRKALAKTSSTPGKTRLINFFLINRDLVFVDLPGYGYAKVSKAERDSWAKMIEKYLSASRNLRGVVLLQDMRRDQTAMDRTMVDLLNHYGIPVVLVLTKADKFSKNRRIQRTKIIKEDTCKTNIGPIPFSSHSGMGVDNLWEAIVELAGKRSGYCLTNTDKPLI